MIPAARRRGRHVCGAAGTKIRPEFVPRAVLNARYSSCSLLHAMPRRLRLSHTAPMRAIGRGKNRVLLIEADTQRRTQLATALVKSGIAVIAVGSIAEIERWPEGDVVVTDVERFTPWWVQVGASHVVVLADTAEQGVDACQRGASAWVPRTCNASLLIGTLRELGD